MYNAPMMTDDWADGDFSDEQLSELRVGVQTLIQELGSQLEAGAAGAEVVDLSLPIGRLSRMEAIQQQKMAEAGRRINERRLLLARAALLDFDRGLYGICKRCDETISFRRLKSRPESPLCVRCQGQLES